MNRNKLISYLAGLFDGEGSFSIQVDFKDNSVRINPRMTMTIKYGNHVLDHLKEAFGGQIYSYQYGFRKWNLSKKQLMLDATEELLPYLRIKKEVAERFIEALRLMPTKRKNHNQHQRTLNKELVLKITEIALSLNHRKQNKESLDSKIQMINEVYEI